MLCCMATSADRRASGAIGSPAPGEVVARAVPRPRDGPTPQPRRGVREGWRFVDRDHKLATVLDALSAAGPGAVIVSGPPGVGRTRLAQEALSALGRAGRRIEWVTCTRTTATMRLGALAHLVAGAGGGEDPTAAWRALVATLTTDPAGGGPTVLGIDDAHLLEDLCAALVHKVVLTGTASVVLTISSGAPVPDLVDALWRDGWATRVELTPLTREHVDQLLSTVLGGIVDSRTVEMLWQTSRGSVVFLHELVHAGHSTERFRNERGIWRWHGCPALTPRLSAVVLSETGELAAAEETAVELLAVAGSLELPDLVALTSAEVVAGLERRGVVVVERVGRRQIAWPAQPLDAQVRSARMPEVLASQYRRQVAATPSVQRWIREDPMRVAGLLLQPDGPVVSPDVLASASARANAQSDHGLAERLARAALDDGPHVPASIALAEAVRWQGRHDEAEQVAASASAAASLSASAFAVEDRERLALTRMLNLFFGLGREEQVEAVAKDFGAIASGVADSIVDRVRTLLQVVAGDGQTVRALVDTALSERSPDPCVRLWACVARTGGLAGLGRTDEALASAGRGWAALGECPDGTESSFARTVLIHAELRALELAGPLPRAQARAAELHRTTMTRACSAADAVTAAGRGVTALAAGRAAEGRRWLAEAVARLGDTDPVGLLPLCRAKLAQAAALLGDAAGARRALTGADGTSPVRAFEPEFLLGVAWSAAAEHRPGDAARTAVRAAASAARLGQPAVEAAALHTAVRLGHADAVAGRLRELADEVDGGLVRAFAQQAEAVARGHGDALDDVATDFQLLGGLGLAADAAAQAAEAHRAAGSRRLASAAAARATALAREVGGLRTPALEQLVPHSLTSREHEVATRAAQGLSNPQIAQELVLSVRTVETHLAHAYDKLGINNRAALADALAGH